jgi:TonB family C-terminal domain
LVALLVSAGYGLMLVRLPAPTPTAISLEHAEIMILPPGDPDQELAAVGSPDSVAALASDGLETAQVVEPTDIPVVEELKPALEPTKEVVSEVVPQQTAMLEVEPPLKEVESAVAIPLQAEPVKKLDEVEPVKETPVKRETVKTKEIGKKKEEKERKKEQPKPKSASSPASRGQAGLGGGQSNASAQSIAAYAATVRSVLVSRTQRIRNLRSTGKVGLVFKINSAGQLASLNLQSSGSAEIDQAVRAALRGVSFPPPPNGSFSGSITITVR